MLTKATLVELIKQHISWSPRDFGLSGDLEGVEDAADAILAALQEVPEDVACLVVAARNVAYRVSAEGVRELDQAVEAFAERIPWDDEPVAPDA